MVIADSLVAAGDTAAPWDSMLAAMGRHDVQRASQLTDRALTMPQVTSRQRATWLYADGERLIRIDEERGVRRVTEAIQTANDGPVGPYARMLLLRLRMGRVETLDSLRAIRTDMEDLLQSSGPTGIQMGRYLRGTASVLETIDTIAAGAPAPDMRLFLAAEVARDSLETPRLAGSLFQQVVRSYPDSPYAAKALLAFSAMNPEAAGPADSLLAARYSDSPYVLAARGEDAIGFVALEDSLLRFANSIRRATRPTTRTPAPASPGSRLPQN
jgi:hypothetical protein